MTSPQDAALGSPIITVHAEDADVGINGAVRYRLRPDLLGNHHTFQIHDVTGQITLKQPLDRERQKVYEVSESRGKGKDINELATILEKLIVLV